MYIKLLTTTWNHFINFIRNPLDHITTCLYLRFLCYNITWKLHFPHKSKYLWNDNYTYNYITSGCSWKILQVCSWVAKMKIPIPFILFIRIQWKTRTCVLSNSCWSVKIGCILSENEAVVVKMPGHTALFVGTTQVRILKSVSIIFQVILVEY